MEHLTFEQIVDAIYSEGLSSENARRIARVNAHVMKCPKCFEIYKAVYDIYELDFDQGRDVVNERLKELEKRYYSSRVIEEITDAVAQNLSEKIEQDAEDFSAQSSIRKYLAQISIELEKRQKIILKNIKNLSNINYYYSYPVALATRGGEQQIDTRKLIDDENIDNLIEINNGILKVQFSKLDFDDNNIQYPLLEILSDQKLLYEGPLDEDNEKLFKNIEINDHDNIIINLKEKL